ncbi:hypothetical protein JW916_12845 [Candidatus Sumerlaeota bacterium]|nr:hypothetical protein [Candidatus Sumerlaeota bacterium]
MRERDRFPNPIVVGFILVLAILGSASYGAEIRMSNGRMIEGEIVKVTSDNVTVNHGGVEILVPRAQIVEPDFDDLYAQAEKAVVVRDHAKAIALCREILVWQPKHADATSLLRRSEDALKNVREKERAAEVARAKEKAAVRQRDADVLKAEDLFKDGNLNDAAAICDRILSEAPDHAGARRLRSRIQEAQDEERGEIEAARRRIEAASQRQEEAVRKAREAEERAERVKTPEYLQGVLGKIRERIATVDDYTCTRTTNSWTPEGLAVLREDICFKRPDLTLNTQTYLQSPVLDQVGFVQKSAADPKVAWKISVPPPPREAPTPAVVDYEGGNVPTPPPTPAPPRATRYDLERLRKEGFSAQDAVPSGDLLRPFDLCGTSTLQLVLETETDWVLTAQLPEAPGSPVLLRLTINQTCGIPVRMEGLDASGNPMIVAEVSSLRVNSGLEDGDFALTPPQGFVVTDGTGALINALKSRPAQ